MTNNKVSFKNVLIFVFGILSIFITAFFAPIVQKKVHQQIVVNAQNDRLSDVSCMFNSIFYESVSYSVSGSFNYKSSDTYTQNFYTLSYNSNNDGTIKYGNNIVYQNGAWVKDSYRYFNIVSLNNDNVYTILNYANGYLDVLINSGRYFWVDAPVMPDVSLETNLSFSSDGRSCTGILFDDIGMSYEFADTGYDKVYTYENWFNSSYKFLNIVTSYCDCQFYLYEFYTGNLRPYNSPTAYSVTYTLNNCTSDSANPTALYSNTDYTFKFNITNLDYDVTFVTVGNATLVNYNSSNGVITANINKVVGNVTFDVSVATQTTFTITYNFGEGVLGNDGFPMTIKNGEIVSGDVSTMSTYQFDSITATNGYLELTYNDTRTSVNFELSGVTANTEILFTAKIPTGAIVGGKYKSSLSSGRLPLNNGIGYENDELYTITTSFESYNGFETLHFVSFNMKFLDYPTYGYTTCTAYFLDSNGQYYHLFEGNDNTWYNNYLKYVTCNTSVSTSQIASNGFYYIYKSTVYDSYTLDSGIYTFKLNNDYYSSSFNQSLSFVYWNGTDFNSTPQSKIIVKNGLYYLSSLNTETIVYGADSYLNNNARCIKVLQSISLNPYVYYALISMLDTGNQIGLYIGGSYTFTFDNLNNKDTSLFTSFNFQYYKDNYYSDYINVKGFEVVGSKLYYILFDNTKVLVYNGSWVEDYYRYISIVYQNVSSTQLDYLNANGVFKNLYVGGNVSTWQQFFFTIADVPLYIFSRIFYFELFGEQTFIIIYSIITILIVFKIVSWALKLKD